MADKKKTGSKLYRLLIVLWLATGLILLGLLFPIGSSSATQNEVDVQQRSSDYNSARYSNVLWSAVETRVTESDVRTCYAERTCQDVVVVDTLVSNLGNTVSVIDIADLNLRIKDGSKSEAKRFDCAGKILDTIDPTLGISCVERGSRVNLKPGQTVTASILFEVDPASRLIPSELDLEILEAHRSTTQPASVSLGAVIVPEEYPIAGVLANSRSVKSEEAELRLVAISQELDNGVDRVSSSDVFVIANFDIGESDVRAFDDASSFELIIGSETYGAEQVSTIGTSQVEVVFELPKFEGLTKVLVSTPALDSSFDVVFRSN